mgnify:CR=1 FL=1
MANSKKDRTATEAIGLAMEDAKKFGNLPIPMMIRNAPTKLMKKLGYGKDEGNDPEGDLMPAKLRGRRYIEPKK